MVYTESQARKTSSLVVTQSEGDCKSAVESRRSSDSFAGRDEGRVKVRMEFLAFIKLIVLFPPVSVSESEGKVESLRQAWRMSTLWAIIYLARYQKFWQDSLKIQSTTTISHSDEAKVIVSAPGVLKGAKHIFFRDSVIGEGAIGAVGGDMYIGCMPGKACDVHWQRKKWQYD